MGASTCDNPRCTCSPCTCGDCRCAGTPLGHLELRIMDIVWNAPDPELTGRDVADQLPNYAYTTVATVLDRLSHKGLLRRALKGRAVHYSPTGSRSEHTAALMHEALRADGDADLALSSFVASDSPAEARALRRALEKSQHGTRRPSS